MHISYLTSVFKHGAASVVSSLDVTAEARSAEADDRVTQTPLLNRNVKDTTARDVRIAMSTDSSYANTFQRTATGYSVRGRSLGSGSWDS